MSAFSSDSSMISSSSFDSDSDFSTLSVINFLLVEIFASRYMLISCAMSGPINFSSDIWLRSFASSMAVPLAVYWLSNDLRSFLTMSPELYSLPRAASPFVMFIDLEYISEMGSEGIIWDCSYWVL